MERACTRDIECLLNNGHQGKCEYFVPPLFRQNSGFHFMECEVCDARIWTNDAEAKICAKCRRRDEIENAMEEIEAAVRRRARLRKKLEKADAEVKELRTAFWKLVDE